MDKVKSIFKQYYKSNNNACQLYHNNSCYESALVGNKIYIHKGGDVDISELAIDKYKTIIIAKKDIDGLGEKDSTEGKYNYYIVDQSRITKIKKENIDAIYHNNLYDSKSDCVKNIKDFNLTSLKFFENYIAKNCKEEKKVVQIRIASDEIGYTYEGVNLHIHNGKNIFSLPVTCIVNAAGTELRGGGGIDGIIHAASGLELKEWEDKNFPSIGVAGESYGPSPSFNIGITNSNIKYIIHALGPSSRDAGSKENIKKLEEKRLLEKVHFETMEIVHEFNKNKNIKTDKYIPISDVKGLHDYNTIYKNNIDSIAFPTISTGLFAYDKKLSIDEVIKGIEKGINTFNTQLKDVHVTIFPKNEEYFEMYVDYIKKRFKN